jgi:hypothetical protein
VGQLVSVFDLAPAPAYTLVALLLIDADSRVQDLGIMNIGSIVPPTLAPLLASVLITSGPGYPDLFAVVGIASAIGAVLVYRVRSVR